MRREHDEPPAGDDLRAHLKRWGYYTVTRYWIFVDGIGPGDSVLAKALDEAPGTKEKAAVELVGRDGTGRLVYMARKLGEECGLDILPDWAVDPIRAKNDAGAPRSTRPSTADHGIPDELRWIDRALSQIWRQSPVRAMVVRQEFCDRGTQRMKARRIELQYGGRFTVAMYRNELRRALDFLNAKWPNPEGGVDSVISRAG